MKNLFFISLFYINIPSVTITFEIFKKVKSSTMKHELLQMPLSHIQKCQDFRILQNQQFSNFKPCNDGFQTFAEDSTPILPAVSWYCISFHIALMDENNPRLAYTFNYKFVIEISASGSIYSSKIYQFNALTSHSKLHSWKHFNSS